MMMKKAANKDNKHRIPAARKRREGVEKNKDTPARGTRIASTGNVFQSRGSVQTTDDIYLEPVKRVVKPANQLQLSEEELGEEITRVLTTNDPNAPDNITKYNYKDRIFKVDPPGPLDHLAIHFSMDGAAIHVNSDAAKEQISCNERRKEEMASKRNAAATTASSAEDEGDTNWDDYGPICNEGKNQFNFSERAAQTINNPLKTHCVSTHPPPKVAFSNAVSQWDIHDTYMRKHAQHQMHVARSLVGGGTKVQEAAIATTHSSLRSITPYEEGEGNKWKEDRGEGDDENDMTISSCKAVDRANIIHSKEMLHALKIMERMVNQNAEDEIYYDFKYWEDVGDTFRKGEGSLLPLWRLSSDKAKKKQVTCLSWNPYYTDLFATSYGSYDFMRQASGMICCYSLKNTSHPEYSIMTESGVMCLEFHPIHHNLLAVGFYDGGVAVYDVRCSNKAIYSSNICTGKHTDPVWQVHWQNDGQPGELSFYSISSDGCMACWIMSKNKLKMEPIMTLRQGSIIREDLDEKTCLSSRAGGCCFDFNKQLEHFFIVGTEEGIIHKYSKAYAGQYLEAYLGHNLPVYALKWNPFHPHIFLSCSADWTVRLWDQSISYPILTFDLGNPVGDIAWAPFSSTVFAAVTSDGKVHIFDLVEDKYKPICEQKVVKRSKLTHVCFNPNEPVILVGDDRGGVNSLRLSPNLRISRELRDEKGNSIPRDSKELQQETMSNVLAAATQTSIKDGL